MTDTRLPGDCIIQGEEQTKRKVGRPRGMDNTPVRIDPAELEQFRKLPLATRGQKLRDEFADFAYMVLKRAKHFAPSVSKTDFGKLTMLMSAAGIAYDKVVPKGDSLVGNLTVNLFKGLPADGLSNVLGNERSKPAAKPRTVSGVS